MYKIAILGASGYTGAELIRIITNHPEMEIEVLAAHSKAGLRVDKVFPHLRSLELPTLIKIEDVDYSNIDLCICALPHKTSQEVIKRIPTDLRIIDLSADFRLQNADDYERWYGNAHQALEVQDEAVYGLTEFYRQEISGARVVAGTGCNAATGQYILRPLVEKGIIDLENIILDLKCAVSGAGRSLKENLLHSELSEGTNAYSVGGVHRHLGEFDQELSKIAGRAVNIQFTPHLIPANRGILATAYVNGNYQSVREALSQRYENEHFIHILPSGETPSTHHVRGSNECHIGIVSDRIENRCIIVAALDNLTKGSSGQAVQNANLMLGIDETVGLSLVPLFP
jgi:N-acetyl-gamma-glutamyl-phosphate reductase